MTRARKNIGRISFVGAGPGDPGLLTVRATEALRRADLLVVDPDVPAAVTALAGPARPASPARGAGARGAGARGADGEARTTGGGQGVETRPAVGDPTDVAKALVTEARNGHHVVRLVAGDPFTDDSVVKETLAVARTQVPFDVVPGVPAVVGVPAYAGVATGSLRTEADVRGLEESEADWASLAAAPGTVVLTATSAHLATVASRLVEHGRPSDTPVCVTVGGTGTAQRSVVTTLAGLDRDAAELRAAAAAAADGADGAVLGGPVVVALGPAVAQRAKLSWWESRPLYGWKVLVPRTKEQAGAMSERLRTYGAIPSEVPTIAVEPPRTPAQMERAIKGLVTGRYEWIVFTSTNAVRAVREKFEEFGLDARAFAGVKIACVGEATAGAVRAFGIVPELLPSGEQSSEGLLADFPPYDNVLDPIDRVLLPRADIATETLAAGLRERGWEIDDVTAYRTVRAAPPPAETREAIKGGGFDAVCFTSSSTVRNLVGIAGKPHQRTVVACIGPQTAATAREFGLRVDVEPDISQVAPLVDALAAYALQLKENGDESPPPRKTRSKGRAAR